MFCFDFPPQPYGIKPHRQLFVDSVGQRALGRLSQSLIVLAVVIQGALQSSHNEVKPPEITRGLALPRTAQTHAALNHWPTLKKGCPGGALPHNRLIMGDVNSAMGHISPCDGAEASLHCLYSVSLQCLVVKNPPANAGDTRDMGRIPGSGRSPGGGHGNPLQCSRLESPLNRGAWQAIVHRVAKSWTQLKRLSTHTMKKVQETLHSLRLCFPNCLQISMFAHWSLLSETSWGTCPTSGKTTSLWRRSFSGVAAHRRLGCDSLFALDAQEQI